MKPEDKYLVLSWRGLHNLVYLLSEKIKSDDLKVDFIAAVARGGLTIAHLLSDFLSLPVASCTITSYRDMIRQESGPQVLCELGLALDGKSVLIIDDVSDTGHTLIEAVSHIKKTNPKKIYTATIHIKPGTKFEPDYYMQTTDKWIIYPFETAETKRILTKKWKNRGESDDQISKKLRDLGLVEYKSRILEQHVTCDM